MQRGRAPEAKGQLFALIASLDTTFDIDPIFFDYNVSTEPDFFFDLSGWEELAVLKLSRFRCPSDLQRIPVPTEGHYLALQPLIGDGQDFAGLPPILRKAFMESRTSWVVWEPVWAARKTNPARHGSIEV